MSPPPDRVPQSLTCRKQEARDAVRLVCSIARSNPLVPAAMVIVSMAVQIGGDLLQYSGEREVVLDLLSRLERDQGWPTLELRTTLVSVWREGGVSIP